MVTDQKGHASRHSDGGSDELDAADLAGGAGTQGQLLQTDGHSASWVDFQSGSDVSDDGSLVVEAPSDINFGSQLDVSDDGDNTVTASVDESGISLANLGNRSHSDLSDSPSSAHHTRPSAGDGLSETSNTFNIDVSQFAGSGLQGDGSENLELVNDTVTIEGNSVSLGGSTSINHNDLSTISSDDHHTKTSSASELTDVSADSVSDAHHTRPSAGTAITDNSNTFDFSQTLSEAGATVITGATDIDFTESGAATVTVTDDADGTATIDISATDNNTTYSAGDGLTLSSTTFSVDVSDFAGTGLAADGSENLDVSGLTTTEIASGTLVTEAEGISNNDNDTSWATSAAVKDYVDSNDSDTTYTAGNYLSLSSTTFSANIGEGLEGDGSDNIQVKERVAYETGHTAWASGLSNAEIHRLNLQSGETFVVERIEFRQKGGGSSSSASVNVYDSTAASVIGSQNLGGTTKDPGSSNSGNLILVRINNSTGSSINASVRVIGYIEGA